MDNKLDKHITIFVKDGCSFCTRAIEEVKKIGCSYSVHNITKDEESIQTLINLNSFKTFPQIYVKNEFIGGYSDLLMMVMTNRIYATIGMDVDF